MCPANKESVVRRKRLTSMLAIAVSAGALLAAGCAAPAAKAPAANAPAANAPAATAPATQAPAAGGAVHIIDYSLNSDGPDSRVILTGAIGDWGQVVAV